LTTGTPSWSNWGTPALRKYLLTTMSVASWLHSFGISASFISKTTEPSELWILLVRVVHSMVLNTSRLPSVNRRLIFMASYLASVRCWNCAIRALVLNREA
jgi:hypothetical protein